MNELQQEQAKLSNSKPNQAQSKQMQATRKPKQGVIESRAPDSLFLAKARRQGGGPAAKKQQKH